MENLNNEIPKHRKKKQSSTSKSNTKSKHKHEYKEVLLIHNNRPHWATVCKICGKIGDLHFFETESVNLVGEDLILMKCLRSIMIWRILL